MSMGNQFDEEFWETVDKWCDRFLLFCAAVIVYGLYKIFIN